MDTFDLEKALADLSATKPIQKQKSGTIKKKSTSSTKIHPDVVNKKDYRFEACEEIFVCKMCEKEIHPEKAGTHHRNHCPHCLSSVHVDTTPGDRAASCHGIMEAISIWVKDNGEWAIIHRCKTCGKINTNRIAADDSQEKLIALAIKPLVHPAFPLSEDEKKSIQLLLNMAKRIDRWYLRDQI